jgi:hypothetical protein
MPILGTLVDRILSTLAPGSNASLQMTTLAHSLPATGPEMIVPVLQSIGITAGQINSNPKMFAQRGNASLNTIGFAFGTGASTPTLSFEVYSLVFHTIIR